MEWKLWKNYKDDFDQKLFNSSFKQILYAYVFSTWDIVREKLPVNSPQIIHPIFWLFTQIGENSYKLCKNPKCSNQIRTLKKIIQKAPENPKSHILLFTSGWRGDYEVWEPCSRREIFTPELSISLLVQKHW